MHTRLSVLLACCLLGACISPEGINPKSARTDPATLEAQRSLQQAGLAALSPATWPATDWWKVLGDAQLDALIGEALEGSPALAVARARLDAALAGVDIAQARLSPSNQLSADITRQRLSSRGPTSANLSGRTFTNHRLAFELGSELDLWGEKRAQLEASVGRLHATQAETHAARLALSVAIARVYVQLAHDHEQRDTARLMLAQRESLLALARERHSSGLDTAIEARLAESGIPEARAGILQHEHAIEAGKRQIAALLGKGPDRGLAIRPPQLAGLAMAGLPAVLPSELIARRPDVVAGRWRIEAALGEAVAARAAFMPDINLVAYIGLQSLSLPDLLRSGSHIFGLGPAIRMPLYGGATLKGTLATRNAELDLAVEEYNQLLVDALREVLDQASTLQAVESMRRETEQGLASAQQAYQMTVDRYRSGLSNRLVVLNAETQLLGFRTRLAELRARRLDASINLVKALGGGFGEEASIQPIGQNRERKDRDQP